MNLTRKQGIFRVEFDTEKKDYEAKMNYNKMGFLADVVIEINESLKDTTAYRQSIKYHANALQKEMERIVGIHAKSYNEFGNVDNDGKSMDARNIYNISSKAYDQAFDFFCNRNPAEIVSAMELVRQYEANGGDLADVRVQYEPIKL